MATEMDLDENTAVWFHMIKQTKEFQFAKAMERARMGHKAKVKHNEYSFCSQFENTTVQLWVCTFPLEIEL